MAVYSFFLVGSNFLAPVFAGFINEGQGWRWVLVRAFGWTFPKSGLILVVLVRNSQRP